MTAMIVSNSWAGVLRYSADGSPGTWSIEGDVRAVPRGETFVIRLHLPTSLGRGEHVIRLVLPNGSLFEEVFST
jgi:hypothetical protein